MKKSVTLLAFTVLVLLVACGSVVFAHDLSEFPAPFVQRGQFDVTFVVGDNAVASDVIGLVDIAMRLQFDTQLSKTIFQPGFGDVKTNELIRVDVGAARLSSEIAGRERDQNLIIVGGPCANPTAAMFLGYPEDCTDGFEYGQAVIKVFDHGNGFYALLVAGLAEDDTRAAARVLASYDQYNDVFVGDELVVSDTMSSRPRLKSLR